MLKAALQQPNLEVVLCHEQDEERGWCPFRQVLQSTPIELINLNIFSRVATPVYSSAEHRVISLSHLAYNLGARPVKKGAKRVIENTGRAVAAGRRMITDSIKGAGLTAQGDELDTPTPSPRTPKGRWSMRYDQTGRRSRDERPSCVQAHSK